MNAGLAASLQRLTGVNPLHAGGSLSGGLYGGWGTGLGDGSRHIGATKQITGPNGETYTSHRTGYSLGSAPEFYVTNKDGSLRRFAGHKGKDGEWVTPQAEMRGALQESGRTARKRLEKLSAERSDRAKDRLADRESEMDRKIIVGASRMADRKIQQMKDNGESIGDEDALRQELITGYVGDLGKPGETYGFMAKHYRLMGDWFDPSSVTEEQIERTRRSFGNYTPGASRKKEKDIYGHLNAGGNYYA